MSHINTKCVQSGYEPQRAVQGRSHLPEHNI